MVSGNVVYQQSVVSAAIPHQGKMGVGVERSIVSARGARSRQLRSTGDWCVIARLHDTEDIQKTDRGGVSWRSSAVSTPSLALATASKDSEQRPTER